ncbi:hypothetical protein C8J57DRAFT_1563800, partial [Mycena rebaudengoi]
ERQKKLSRRGARAETPGNLDKKNHITLLHPPARACGWGRACTRGRLEEFAWYVRLWSPGIGAQTAGCVTVYACRPRTHITCACACPHPDSHRDNKYVCPSARSPTFQSLSRKPAPVTPSPRIRRRVRRRRRERGRRGRDIGVRDCVGVPVRRVCVCADVCGCGCADVGVDVDGGDPDADTGGAYVPALSNDPADRALSMHATGVGGAVGLELDAKEGRDRRRPRTLRRPLTTPLLVSRLALPRSLYRRARGRWRSSHLAPQIRGRRRASRCSHSRSHSPHCSPPSSSTSASSSSSRSSSTASSRLPYSLRPSLLHPPRLHHHSAPSQIHRAPLLVNAPPSPATP